MMRLAVAWINLDLIASGHIPFRQSVLDPHGRYADAIAWVGLGFLIICTLIYVAVLAVIGRAVRRRPAGDDETSLQQSHCSTETTEAQLRMRVLAASIATVCVLVILIGASAVASHRNSQPAPDAAAVVIEITGNQWWWQARYLNQDPQLVLQTANEIHIPVGKDILIQGKANDVIHSFWVPELQGKRDLIPGHTTMAWIHADQPGIYRGQCAEFCGLQHAHMALLVVAEPEASYRQWFQHQLQPAATPASTSAVQGQRVFLDHACVLCHTIRGTTAGGLNAPDLTHLASRLTLAAGTLANNKGNLGGWISDPQTIKPGNHMATVPLSGDDLRALLDYLETLK